MRIVVTGLGVVSAIGNNLAEFSSALRSGHCGIGAITQIPDAQQLRVPIAAELGDFEPADYFSKKDLVHYDRYTQLQILSVREAIGHASLDIDDALAKRCCAILGTAVGGQNTQEESYRRLFVDKSTRALPWTVPRLIPSSAVGHVSMVFGIKGPSYAVASACASAGHAISQACMTLRSGLADVAITGGAESCITLGTMRGWEALRVMSSDTCRPFCKDRSGMVLGEGAGTLVLETLEHAQARGAIIHAEVAGIGMSADAGNIIQPSGEGASDAMQAALLDAGLGPSDIQYINAHGTGTSQNDPTETDAIRRVFGQHAYELAVSSTKSMHGHSLGAASAIESIASILAIRDQYAPPTINFTEADSSCDLDYVPNKARPMDIDSVVSNSFAFGGLNSSIVYRKFEP